MQQAFDVRGNTNDQHCGGRGGRDGWQESNLVRSARSARTARDWPAGRRVTDAWTQRALIQRGWTQRDSAKQVHVQTLRGWLAGCAEVLVDQQTA
jgi:hypothetical protein